jgi:hypothetical protein
VILAEVASLASGSGVMAAASVAPQTATDIKAETAIKKPMCFIVVLPRVNAGMTQQFQTVLRQLRHVGGDPSRRFLGQLVSLAEFGQD